MTIQMKQKCNILPISLRNGTYVKGNTVMNLPPYVKESSPEEKKKYIDATLRRNHKQKVRMSKSPLLLCDQSLGVTGYGLTCVDDDEALDRTHSPFYDAQRFDTTEDFFGCDDSYKYGAFDRITVIPETNTVVRFTTETYDLEEGMEILDDLRATRYAMKEGQGLVEPEEVA